MLQDCHQTRLLHGRRLPTCLLMQVPMLDRCHYLTHSCPLSAIMYCVSVKWLQTWHDTTDCSMVTICQALRCNFSASSKYEHITNVFSHMLVPDSFSDWVTRRAIWALGSSASTILSIPFVATNLMWSNFREIIIIMSHCCHCLLNVYAMVKVASWCRGVQDD